jgi:hypothetical protein
MSEKSSIVYWSPAFKRRDGMDWNMLYSDPESVFEKNRPLMTNISKGANFFYCPAFSNLSRNTFVLKNPISSHYEFFEDGTVKGKEPNHINAWCSRPPSIEGRKMMEYGLSWIFFSEDDIEVTLTSPYFENAPHLNYASLVPGKLNISKWFRNINLEYCLYHGINKFGLERDETLGYVSFNSINPVKLVRFEMSEKLQQYANSGNNSTTWDPWITLLDRYRRFKETHMNKLILKEIKKNLVDTDTDL